MLDAVRRARNKVLGHSSQVIKDIPDVLKRDDKGNLFMRYDSGFGDKNRIIIFIAEQKISYLSKVDTLVIDGTFKSCPQGFYQVVVIHGYIFEKTFPMIYILLSNKSESSYVRAFSKCRELVTLNADFVITDFERALINAVRVSFYDAEHFGCLFHLGQAAWRRVGALGEISLFKNNAFYKRIFKMTLCLAFIPPHEVLIYYREIEAIVQSNGEPILDNFLNYFKKNYLGIVETEELEETDPSFNIEFWNAYVRILKGVPRTSNNAESWNRTFNLRVDNPHPNIAHFISCLLQMEYLDLYDLMHCHKGIFNVPCSQKEKNLYNLIRNKRFFKPLEYLEAIIGIYYFKFEKEQ
jgi:MULE transposase domain